MLEGGEILSQLLLVGGIERLLPIVAEFLRLVENVRRRGRVQRRHIVRHAVVSQIGGKQLASRGVESIGVVRRRGGLAIDPGAVGPLVSVQSAEGNDGGYAPEVGSPRKRRSQRCSRRQRQHLPAVVVEVEHVGLAEAAQVEEERPRVSARNAADESTPAAIAGVVEIEHQPAVHVGEQDGVLVVVRNRDDVDAWSQLHPLPARQHADVESLGLEIVVDARSLVIGDEDLLVAKQRERVATQMVGGAVGNPQVLAAAYGYELLSGDLVSQTATAEVGWAGDPRIGREDRRAVVKDERGISNRLESQVEGHGVPSNCRGLIWCSDPVPARGRVASRPEPGSFLSGRNDLLRRGFARAHDLRDAHAVVCGAGESQRGQPREQFTRSADAVAVAQDVLGNRFGVPDDADVLGVAIHAQRVGEPRREPARERCGLRRGHRHDHRIEALRRSSRQHLPCAARRLQRFDRHAEPDRQLCGD